MAIKGNRGSNYSTGSVTTDGVEQLVAKLGMVQERLRTPGPVLQDIARLFSAMEAERFAQGGASAFGTSAWAPLTQATIDRRARSGGPGGSEVLVGLGFLRAAAISPLYTSIDLFAKEITLSINPKDKGAKLHPSGANYAAVQQQTRPFVEITPTFRIMAKDIARNYFLEPMGMDVPLPGAARASSSPAPMGGETATAKGYATHQHRLSTGANIDHRTTASRNLQQEYSNVQAARITGDTSAFSGKAAFNAANKRVGRYLSTASLRKG